MDGGEHRHEPLTLLYSNFGKVIGPAFLSLGSAFLSLGSASLSFR